MGPENISLHSLEQCECVQGLSYLKIRSLLGNQWAERPYFTRWTCRHYFLASLIRSHRQRRRYTMSNFAKIELNSILSLSLSRSRSLSFYCSIWFRAILIKNLSSLSTACAIVFRSLSLSLSPTDASAHRLFTRDSKERKEQNRQTLCTWALFSFSWVVCLHETRLSAGEHCYFYLLFQLSRLMHSREHMCSSQWERERGPMKQSLHTSGFYFVAFLVHSGSQLSLFFRLLVQLSHSSVHENGMQADKKTRKLQRVSYRGSSKSMLWRRQQEQEKQQQKHKQQTRSWYEEIALADARSILHPASCCYCIDMRSILPLSSSHAATCTRQDKQSTFSRFSRYKQWEREEEYFYLIHLKFIQSNRWHVSTSRTLATTLQIVSSCKWLPLSLSFILLPASLSLSLSPSSVAICQQSFVDRVVTSSPTVRERQDKKEKKTKRQRTKKDIEWWRKLQVRLIPRPPLSLSLVLLSSVTFTLLDAMFVPLCCVSSLNFQLWAVQGLWSRRKDRFIKNTENKILYTRAREREGEKGNQWGRRMQEREKETRPSRVKWTS